MRKAVVDLGTNTFNLLIGELTGDGLKIIFSTKIPVMLGMGGINEGKISADAYLRALDAMEEFKFIAQNHDTTDIRGIATSAVRSATNGQDLVDEVYEKLGIPIQVISGPEEADLICKGVKLTKEIDDSTVIMDIGGGSTEFIYLMPNGNQKLVSLNIGVSRVFQKLGKPKDFKESDLSYMSQFFDEEAKDSFDFSANVLVGASGTFETFWEMINKRRFESDGKSHLLPWEEFNHLLDWAIHSTYDERHNHPWIVDMRKGMLPIGALKIKWIIEKLGVKEVWLSPYSLKEGAFVS